MNFNKVVLNKIKSNREDSKKKHELKKEEIYLAHPSLKELDKILKGYMISISMGSSDIDLIKKDIEAIKLRKAKYLKDEKINFDFNNISYHCNKCKDTGFINDKKCSCYLKIFSKEVSDFLGLTKIFSTENFNKLDLEILDENILNKEKLSQRENYEIILKDVKSFLKSFNTTNKSFVFTGGVGLGKSFLCNCITKYLLDRGHLVILKTANEIIDDISFYKFNQNKTYELKDNYMMILNCDLLIIDDLGVEHNNSFSEAEIYNIINHRIKTKKSTIISTNLSTKDISNYSARISSRLFGHFKFYSFLGRDLRLKSLKKNS